MILAELAAPASEYQYCYSLLAPLQKSVLAWVITGGSGEHLLPTGFIFKCSCERHWVSDEGVILRHGSGGGLSILGLQQVVVAVCF